MTRFPEPTPPPMGEYLAALEQARQLWGAHASVNWMPGGWFAAGTVGGDLLFSALGRSFDEAIANAEARRQQVLARIAEDPSLGEPLNDGWTAAAAERARDMKVSEQLARVVRGEA